MNLLTRHNWKEIFLLNIISSNELLHCHMIYVCINSMSEIYTILWCELNLAKNHASHCIVEGSGKWVLVTGSARFNEPTGSGQCAISGSDNGRRQIIVAFYVLNGSCYIWISCNIEYKGMLKKYVQLYICCEIKFVLLMEKHTFSVEICSLYIFCRCMNLQNKWKRHVCLNIYITFSWWE